MGKTTLDFDETILVLLEADKSMKQDNSSSGGLCGDGGALLVMGGGNRKGGKGKHKFNIKCYYCYELRHIQTVCSKAKEDLKELKRAQGKGSVAIDMDKDGFGDVLIVQEEKQPKDSWWFDLGVPITYVVGERGSHPTRSVKGRW